MITIHRNENIEKWMKFIKKFLEEEYQDDEELEIKDNLDANNVVIDKEEN